MDRTLKALSLILSYPSQDLQAAMPAIADQVSAERRLPLATRTALEALAFHLGRGDLFDLQETYVMLFDRSRTLSLNLFEHVHGESRERGGAMVSLIETYRAGGFEPATSELPDHLPVLLEFASTQPPQQAREFLAETAHIVRKIFSALLKRASPYASVLAAVLELAGEKAEVVPVPAEPPMDESWAEPEVFGGCSTEGQARPGQPQPVRIVRNASSHASSHGVQP